METLSEGCSFNRKHQCEPGSGFREDWKLIKSLGIEWNGLLTMSCGQSFSRVPERKFSYDRQQIKRRMTWCQLSWLSKRVIGPWKLLCPVSKVKEEQWSLVIFFHFLILLLPLFAPLLHPLLPLGAVGGDDGLYHPSGTSLFRCAQSRSGTRASCSPPQSSHSERAGEQTETGTHGWTDRRTSYLSLLLLLLQHQFVP